MKTRERNLIDTDHIGLTQMSLYLEGNRLFSPMSGSYVIVKATCMNKTRSINLSGRDEVDLSIGAEFGHSVSISDKREVVISAAKYGCEKKSFCDLKWGSGMVEPRGLMKVQDRVNF